MVGEGGGGGGGDVQQSYFVKRVVYPYNSFTVLLMFSGC